MGLQKKKTVNIGKPCSAETKRRVNTVRKNEKKNPQQKLLIITMDFSAIGALHYPKWNWVIKMTILN